MYAGIPGSKSLQGLSMVHRGCRMMGIYSRTPPRLSMSHLQESSSTGRLLHGGKLPAALCLYPKKSIA